MMTQIHAHSRRERGQALAEFSLVLPILLIVVFGIIDFGRVLFVFSDASGSLRDAARNAEILGVNSGVPTYADCDAIIGEALSTRFVANEVADVYYFDTTTPDTTTAPFDHPVGDTEWASDNETLLQWAHYTCEGGATLATYDPPLAVGASSEEIDVAGSGVLSNGDIMRVHYRGRVDFITPFINAVWSGIDIDFFAQRSIVTQLTLGSSGGLDFDYDGLDDRWELMWYGCIDEDDDTITHTIHPNHRFEPLDNWTNWKLSDGVTTWQSECGIRVVPNPWDDPADTTDDTLDMPAETNTIASNAVSDADGDGCNNGCEETRNSQPIIDTVLGVDGYDTDGDGVSDGDEAVIYRTNPSGGDWYYCAGNDRAGTAPVMDGIPDPVSSLDGDGVPDGYDSDCDGVPDGVELGLVEPYGDTVVYKGKETAETGISPAPTGNPFSPSEARYLSTDDTDVDSDGDGLTDYQEYYWLDNTSFSVKAGDANDDPAIPNTLCDGLWDGTTRPVEGAPYECHADYDGSTSSFDTLNEYRTDPTYYNIDETEALIDGLDTDGDGLNDDEEIFGYSMAGKGTWPVYMDDGSTQSINGNTTTYYLHPNYKDTDGDGLTDFEEVTTIRSPNNGYTDPTNPDTDGDGLEDGYEIDNSGNPLNADSDNDGLRDGIELTLPANPNPDYGTTIDSASEPLNQNSDRVVGSEFPVGGFMTGDEVLNLAFDNGSTLDLGNSGISCILDDGYEWDIGLDPTDEDTDDDGLSDGDEICTTNTDPLSTNSDSGTCNDGGPADGVTDIWTDLEELEAGSNPRDVCSNPNTVGSIVDQDNDGLPDWWENNYFGDYNLSNPGDQSDGDTCDNLCEYLQGTDPTVADTDGDGLLDDEELPNSSPTDEDTDNDGIWDGDEADYTYEGVNFPLDARNNDSDGDGLLDGFEAGYMANISNTYIDPDTGLACALNAGSPDTDGEGLYDNLEIQPANFSDELPANYYANAFTGGVGPTTNPCDPDTDDDYWTDFEEIFVWSATYDGFYRVANPADDDSDNDGIADGLDSSDTSITEQDIAATDFWDNDTDDDGLHDGDEFYNPDERDRRDISGTTFLDGFALIVDQCGSAAPAAVNYTIDTETSPLIQDTDGDGLWDGEEVGYTTPDVMANGLSSLYDGDNLVSGLSGTHPNNNDTDEDSDPDGLEHDDGDPATDPLCGDDSSGGEFLNCPGIDPPLATSEHSDCDGLTDALETTGHAAWGDAQTLVDDVDSDNDGINDDVELDGQLLEYTWTNVLGVSADFSETVATNPTHQDLDGDGDADGYDTDDDGLSDKQEFDGQEIVIFTDCNPLLDTTESLGVQSTHPNMRDTDGDGMPDKVELDRNVNPLDGTCGPEIIKNKIDESNSVDALLETALDYHWRTDPTTADETQDSANLIALNYLQDGTFSGFFETGLSTGSDTFTASFTTNLACPTAGSDTIGPFLDANATTVTEYRATINGSSPGEVACYWTADVTFEQFITIMFNDDILYVTDYDERRYFP